MDSFIALYLLLLAAFVGYTIAAKLASPLHTQLLVGSSFINGIVLIGAMIAMSHAHTSFHTILGFIAVALATANAVGAYLLLKRVLKSSTNERSNIHSGGK